jgi:hypothetical protein
MGEPGSTEYEELLLHRACRDSPPHAPFGSIITLGNGAPGTVAIRPDGTTLATWVQTPNPNDSDGPVWARIAPPQANRPATTVPLPGAITGFAPLAAFTPAGRAVVTWTTTSPTAEAVAISTHDPR